MMTDTTDTSDDEVERLAVLTDGVWRRLKDGERFSMRVPAEPERDMDLILHRAAATLRALLAERDRLLKALGDKDEALLHIAQWAEAYPEDIFPPVDVASAREKVGDDALFSRLHAEWARHLCKGIGAIARAALEETGHD
jgi:hypothetical protein